MFALLGVHCGPDITVPAAASLAGFTRAEAGRVLAELAEASLAAEHRPGRFVLHDLVRGYAAGLARQALTETGIRAAIVRSLDHYLHTGVLPYLPSAFRPASPAPGVLPERLADEAEMVAWGQAEHQVLLQAIAQAAAAGLLTRAWQLLDRQALFLDGQGYWVDLRATGQIVLAAAADADDQAAQGWTHLIIGRDGTLAGAHDQSRAHQLQALDHFRRAGDLPGQAWALLLAGFACAWKGDWAEAGPLAEQALALFWQTGDHAGQGWALAGLGHYHVRLGNYDLARGYARQALEVTPQDGDPAILAFAGDALGLVHSGLGEPRQAINCYRRALDLVRERKDPLARGIRVGLLTDFGVASRAAGDLAAAAGAWQQAQQILRDLGLPENAEIRAWLDQAGSPIPPG
jgi:tetratricopeptide (TPR) repeat protein